MSCSYLQGSKNKTNFRKLSLTAQSLIDAWAISLQSRAYNTARTYYSHVRHFLYFVESHGYDCSHVFKSDQCRVTLVEIYRFSLRQVLSPGAINARLTAI